MTANDESWVKVVVRFRPLIGTELGYNPLTCIEITEDQVTIYPPGTISLTFTFNSVLEPISTQEQMYDSAPRNIVEAIMQGFNGTIFTYGQLSSGKTYTMFGETTEPERMGIVPRMINTIFDTIDTADENIEFLIKVSFCELYMEKIYDLLNPLGNDLKLKNNKKGPYIENLREVYTSCDFDIHELIKVGLLNKSHRDSQSHGRASASHTLFSISVQQVTPEGSYKVGKLYLVDLAGTEKGSVASSPTFKHEQMKSVNTSLTTLGIIISTLAEKTTSFIPYRASKLTRILQESLGGNSKTALIITCSPSPLNVEETLSSLRFGTRVKSVKNHPVVNREHSLIELKGQFVKKLDIYHQMSYRISVLEEKLDKVNQERLSLRMYSAEDEGVKCLVDYSEIKQEIDDVRDRILEQEELKKHYEMNIESTTFSINELKIAEEQHKINLEELENQSNILDIELKDIEHNLEILVTSIDTMSTNLESENLDIESMELTLAKIQAEIEHSKCQLKCLTEMRSSLSKAAVEEQLRRRIREEKDKNKIMKEEMRKMEYEIDLLLFKKYRDYIEADALQATGKKNFEVELAIDKARMKFLEDERNMNSVQKNAKTQLDALSKMLDKISKEYRGLTGQFSESQLEKMIFQRKSVRLEEKVKILAEDIDKIDKRLARIEKVNGNASQIGELGRLLQKSNSVNSSLPSRRLQYSINGGFS
ncbi:hypothetical protein SteCoe_20181 [Stentor coeruleus]|uniref:Kinesin motor domain-containing protein n=1 Tax=Stentor coeruleus TaxID=5963 RepID=A0A1R2BSE9_9CILI|nr:hypothetical protein SteCoe_20181 [Stentor coeruleus]